MNLTVITGVSGLTYSPSTISTCINTPIATATPSVTGAGTITYSISPALPAGISLNTTTGVISGTPTVAASGTYTVTAGNGCSSTSVSIIITVSPIPVITSVTATPATICLGASSNLVVTAPAGAATTIVNYDFNNSSGTGFATLSPALASGITSTASGTAALRNCNRHSFRSKCIYLKCHSSLMHFQAQNRSNQWTLYFRRCFS